MREEMKRDYLVPVRIVAQQGCEGAERLLHFVTDQAYFGEGEECRFKAGGWVLLDFGKEYSGGVRLIVNDCSGEKNGRVRIRFGESASEACSEPGGKNATNDHAVRDSVVTVAWVSCVEFGNTGYRFIRIDNVWDKPITFRQIFGVYIHRGTRFRGKFSCSDERLNDIWKTAARTVYLNMQDYLYDGIKRDRVVWIGDMHPAASSVRCLFGAHPIIVKSLDFVRDHTPPDRWMNDIPTYTCWWLKLQTDQFRFTGDRRYLAEQLGYVRALVPLLCSAFSEDGTDKVTFRFLDWPSSTDPAAQAEGVRALFLMAFESAAYILRTAGDDGDAAATALCEGRARAIRSMPPLSSESKTAASLSVFAGLKDACDVNKELLSRDPAGGISTFLGYYVLRARGDAGDIAGALDLLRRYWGGMIDLGATTFWEDFDLGWAEDASPIDVLPQKGERDVHGDNGNYCYRGFRHSLCHGWASGPVPFLSEYVLGVRIAETGCKKMTIAPHLGDLLYAEGVVPTSLGDLWVRHEKRRDRIETLIHAPEGMEIVLDSSRETNMP